MNYSKKTCPTCDGRRWVLPEQNVMEEPSESVELIKCTECNGEGVITISPYYITSKETAPSE